MQKILVALDFTDNHQSVFKTGISLAQTTGATLMLLHVLSLNELDYSMLPIYTYDQILDDREYEIYLKQLTQYEQKRLDWLESLSQEATTLGINTEYTQLKGNPGRMICDLANNWSAELIIVGSRGLRGLKQIFLGSVSNYVTHNSPCSVLLVREEIEVRSDHQPISDTKSINVYDR